MTYLVTFCGSDPASAGNRSFDDKGEAEAFIVANDHAWVSCHLLTFFRS